MLGGVHMSILALVQVTVGRVCGETRSSGEVPDGMYLYDPLTDVVCVIWDSTCPVGDIVVTEASLANTGIYPRFGQGPTLLPLSTMG